MVEVLSEIIPDIVTQSLTEDLSRKFSLLITEHFLGEEVRAIATEAVTDVEEHIDAINEQQDKECIASRCIRNIIFLYFNTYMFLNNDK